MSDEFDEQSERLLPCTTTITKDCGVCDRCIHRPAVAAALREVGTARDIYKRNATSWRAKYNQDIAELRAERDRWKENFESSPAVQQAIKRFHMQIENNSKSGCFRRPWWLL